MARLQSQQGIALGVVVPVFLVVAFTDDVPIFDNDATYQRVGPYASQPVGRQL